jgi:hypothetical protein
VLRVVEIALFDVLVAGYVYRVRLAGGGLPPVHGVVGCYGEEARSVAEGLAPVGSTIALESAPSEGDRAARRLRLVGRYVAQRADRQGEGYSRVDEQGARGRYATAGLWEAAVGIRGAMRCESLSGYFSASHVGLTGDLSGGVPYGRPR